MKVLGVIPARLHSTRLPRKPLLSLAGKPLIQWTWENVNQSHIIDKVIIAVDSQEVAEIAASFGAEVVKTATSHVSGTDRIAEAVRELDFEIIINIQADEPLLHPSIIDELAQCFLKNNELLMATAKTKIRAQHQIQNPNVVKVITDRDNFALYFSRYAIPFKRDFASEIDYYKHIGIYAYTKDFLYTFKNLPPSCLEQAEKLEQLRVLEAGYKIKVVETSFDSHGVDVPEDIEAVERMLIEKSHKKTG